VGLGAIGIGSAAVGRRLRAAPSRRDGGDLDGLLRRGRGRRRGRGSKDRRTGGDADSRAAASRGARQQERQREERGRRAFHEGRRYHPHGPPVRRPRLVAQRDSIRPGLGTAFNPPDAGVSQSRIRSDLNPGGRTCIGAAESVQREGLR